MTLPKTTRTVFVVQEIGWTFNDEWYYRDGMEDDKPFVAYASRERAEAELLHFEREKWQEECPFLFGYNIAAITHLTEDEFVRHVEHLGLTPPTAVKRRRDWLDWWEGIEDEMTPEQREGICGVMTKVKLHEVVAVELERP